MSEATETKVTPAREARVSKLGAALRLLYCSYGWREAKVLQGRNLCLIPIYPPIDRISTSKYISVSYKLLGINGRKLSRT